LIAAIYRRISALLLLLVVICTTQICWAHAILKDSTPAPHSTVKGPDFDITLRYNVRIDGTRSRVLLVSPDGQAAALKLGSQPSPDTLQARATGLKPGAYKLQWKVLASDGHMSSGEIRFTVN